MSVEHDVPYSKAGDIELKLDVYKPEGESKRAAILYFHGGSWRAGSKNGMRADAEAMAAYGFVGIPTQYRLLQQAPFPANINDVKTAIRWTRKNADKLGIDPERIILWGSSAGAHLALLAAGTQNDPRFERADEYAGVSTSIAGVVAVHPPTGFHHGAPTPRLTSAATNLLGEGYKAADADLASPMTYVSKDFPPTLLLTGTEDRRVPHPASQAFHDALKEVGATVDLHLFYGHNHGFAAIPSMRKVVATIADYFLDRAIIDPAKYKAEAEQHSAFARRAAEERAAAAAAAAA